MKNLDLILFVISLLLMLSTLAEDGNVKNTVIYGVCSIISVINYYRK